MRRSLLIGVGVFALILVPAVPTAAADPDTSAAVATTCDYRQITTALRIEHPDVADKLAEDPMAQSVLQEFLSADTDRRREIANQLISLQGAEEYIGVVNEVAVTCQGY